MENASKALIIAGAILISILIIALGVFIYNNAANTVKSADMTEYEIQAFNSKFERYLDGGNVDGKPITYENAKGLVETIRTHNNNPNNRKVFIGVYINSKSFNEYSSILKLLENNKDKKLAIYNPKDHTIYENGIFYGVTIKEAN